MSSATAKLLSKTTAGLLSPLILDDKDDEFDEFIIDNEADD